MLVRTFLLACLLATTAASAQQKTVAFGCDAGVGAVCNFTLRPVRGMERQFSVPSGQRTEMSGVIPLKERYCVCVGVATPLDWAECKTPYRGSFCKAANVNSRYNN